MGGFKRGGGLTGGRGLQGRGREGWNGGSLMGRGRGGSEVSRREVSQHTRNH